MPVPFQPRFVDLVRNLTTTNGTSNFVLGAAVSGFTSFSPAILPGESFYYSAIGVDKPAEREVGRGTMQANGTISRDAIGGQLTSFTGGAKSIALIAAAEWFNLVQAGSSSGGSGAASRVELAALTSRLLPVILSEAGREGIFVFDSANLSARVTADPAQGIYIAPAATPTGASGAWVRKFTGAANAKWFGATGDGVTNDYAALQAWLDSGGDLYLPKGKYISSARLLVRNFCIITAGYGFDARIISGGGTMADMPGAQIKFPAGVSGVYFMNQSVLDDVATNVGNVALYRTQEGAMHSRMSNVGIIGGGGAAATGVYARTLVHLDGVQVYNFSGKGFDISASSDVPDGNSEYGAASTSTLKNCLAKTNGSHGFHIRGRDANVIKLDTCNAQLNGGWGFLDDGLLGNTYSNCHAATNTSGSFKGSSLVGTHTFDGCYAEVGIGYNCDLNSACQVVGNYLAQSALTNNAAPIKAQVFSSEITQLNKINLKQNWDNLGAISGEAWVYRHADQGIVHHGAANVGGTYCFTVRNSLDQAVMQLHNTVTNAYFAGPVIVTGTVSGSNLTGTNSGDQTITLTGDVTGSGTGSFATTIGANKVTFAKFVAASAASIVGATAAGNFAELTPASARTVLGLAAVATSGSATDLTTGTLPIAQTAAFSGGDVTKPSGSGTLTIAAGAVTLAKMADMATASVVYRKTAGSGAPEVQTLATLKSDLGLTGTNSGDQTITLTGNVTGSGTGSFATTIAAAAVTLAMQANMATASVVYRKTTGSGAPEVQTLATLKTDLGLIGTNSGDQTITLTGDVTGSGAGSFAATIGAASVTYAKIQNVSATSKLLGRASAGAGVVEELGLAGGLTISGTNLTLGALTPTSVAATGAMTTSSPTAGNGYAAGAGGTVTQSPNKSSAVTLNTVCGAITMNAAALATVTNVTFTLTNSAIAATDVVVVAIKSGSATAGTYQAWVSGTAAGSCTITVRNISGGSLSEALVLNFAVNKAVIA